MAITYLASRGMNNNNSSVLSQPTGISYLASQGREREEEKNRGGILGGIGYLGEKLAVGAVSSIEGISDYTFSGLAKLFGRDDWAEDIIKNDWFGDWYSHPEEWFNPGKGWQVAGDVASGIGSSLPGMAAAVGVTALTGGLGAGAAASFVVSGLGAAGRATKEAYEQTGKLTGKEYGYGALVGATEGGIEALSNLIGMGSGAVVKSFSKALGKETAEAFTKQGIIKTLGSSFLGEAFEESASEILTPYWQRATYDPNAKNASIDEILYAGVVGGLSGMVMGGTSYGIDTTKSYISGNKIAQRGTESQVLSTAADFESFENENKTGDELFSEIISRRKELLKSLESTGGRATTVSQQREIGALERANVAAASKLFVARRAQNIVNNADTIAQRLSAYGYKKADGTPITYTADQLTAGYDKNRPQTIFKALSTNETLRSLAVADATGQLMMDTAQFKQKTLTGQRLASQADLNRFVQQASEKEVAAVSKALQIDSWSGLTADTFNQKIIDFVNNGGVERTLQTNERKSSFASIPVEQAQKVPKIVNLGKDGVRRYTDGKLDIAVERKGDEYTIYDYNTETFSRGMSRDEVNSVFRDYAKRSAETQSQNSKLSDIPTVQSPEVAPAITAESAEHQARIAEISKFQSEVREVDSFARENVKEYARLSQPTKDMIKSMIVDGRKKGISDSDLTMYARVSAHSGIDIVFDKEATRIDTSSVSQGLTPSNVGFPEANKVSFGGSERGEGNTANYADGFYEASKNRIVVNPEGKRTAEKLLIYELDHAIRKYFDSEGKQATRIYFEAIEGVDQATRDKILGAYKKTAKPGEVAAVVMDETNAYYAEQVLGNKYTLEKLLEAEPTLKDKILSFFKGASTDYADVPKLSSAAKKYYRTYKKLFEEFSARNVENNASENAHLGSGFEKNAQKISITGANSENMQVSGRDYAVGTENKVQITAEMSDSERANVLRNRTLTAPIYKGQADSVIEDVKSNYEREKKAFGKKAVVEIAERLGLIKESINFDDIDVQIKLSKSNLRESIVKEANPSQIAKLLPILGQTAKSSVAVERHNNRYYYDTDTEYVDNLMGAYIDGESLVPVRFGLKHSKMGKTTLYVLVDQNKIPLKKLTEIKNDRGLQDASSDLTESNSLPRSVTYSISQILSFVNSKDLLRYIPDDFLDSDRIDAKRKAIAETQKYTDVKNDEHYEEYVKEGKVATAKQMLAAKAKAVGYTDVNAEEKTSDITYDDEEKLIPISKRYDKSNSDKRYALDIDSDSENISGAEVKPKAKAKPKAKPKTNAKPKAKSKTKAQVRAEQVVENQKIRTKAEYTTDKVFSQASVKRGFESVEAVNKIPASVREDIARKLWIELEMSDSDDVRDTFALKYSIELYQAIREADSEAYENMSPKQRDELQAQLRDAVREIAKSGKESKLTRMKGDVRGIVKLEERVGSEIKSQIYQNLKKIDDRKKLRFIEASGYKGDLFKGTLDALTRIDWRGKFSSNIARTEIKKLAEWYNEENPMLKGFETPDENSKKTVTTNFSHDIRGMLEMLSEGEGDFSNRELKMLADVTGYFSKLVTEYDKVYIEGKWQDGETLAKELVENVHQQERAGVPIAIRAMRNKLLSAWFRTFGDALSVMKLADMYGDGIFTRYYNELMQAEINSDAEAMRIKEKYDAFMKSNPKFLANAEKEAANLYGVNVRKIDLISYAMTLKRKQSWESIAEGGVVFEDPKDGNDNHIYPAKNVTKGEGYSKRLEAAIKAELDEVMSMLSEKDVEYMKVLEEGFELARTTKAMGDMQRLGFASVIEGYYYPIKHEYTDHLSNFEAELIATDRYANASFNKNQTEGAKSAIRIKSADATFNSHIKGVSRYLYLSPVMDSFNKLYKLKVGDESLQRTINKSKTAWRQDGKLVGFDYLQNLMLDIMGMGKNVGDDFFARIRGASVNFALGANPKVLVTQLSSLISSTSILSGWSHIGAIGIWDSNVDNYSVVAKLRNSDYTVAKAEGVIDRINTSTRIFTAGISLMDRFVVTRAWAACQVEVAKNGGPAVGTEENRIAAGKLLDKVILETQQNSLTSRRTEGARRGNILTKGVQMYKSDAITLFGRVVDGMGEVSYLNALLKNDSLTDAERKSIENRLEKAGKGLAKSVGAVIGNAVFMMLITEMFRNLYGKNDDETEEEKKNRIVLDAIGNLLSGMPIVSEIYSYFTSGYSLDSMEMSSINDFLGTAQKVIDYTEKKLEGKATERDGNKLVQDMLYGAGQVLGVPTRNIKNLSYGVVRLFSKDAAYKWDNALYKKSYSADLNEAVAKGDIGRATMIMELALKEKLGSGFDIGAINELTRLGGLGKKVIPGDISDTITVNGEEIVLGADQYEAVKAEYDNVISATNDFIESKFYKSLNDEQKAKALIKIYSTYKDIAYDTVLGTNRNERAFIMSKLVKGEVLNAYLSLGVIESDVDAQGNAISGLKRTKVVAAINGLGVSVEQRLLLICASGYALKDGDVRGVSANAAKSRLLKYILKLRGLTADERLEIAEMCGFEVRNGKIVNNFSKNLREIAKK